VNRTLFRTRVKFCGMTRPGDVRLASELGVDAVGFVFAAKSRRRVTPAEARTMRNALGPLVDAVTVFQDNTPEEVREAIRQVRPTILQFHGDEDDAFCRSFGMPYLRAISAVGHGNGNGGADASAGESLVLRYPSAAGFLFDSHAPGTPGGTGETFDWSRLPTGLTRPFVVAGGLDPDNVFDAIVATLPWGVDVSSGIEAEPGVKDGDRMRRFVAEVRRADCHEA
jgi:phosphoribosylanthranilate isomerase